MSFLIYYAIPSIDTTLMLRFAVEEDESSNENHFSLNHHSTVNTLVAEADQEDRFVFLHAPLMPAQTHLYKPMVELVVDLVILLLHQVSIVAEAVAEEV